MAMKKCHIFQWRTFGKRFRPCHVAELRDSGGAILPLAVMMGGKRAQTTFSSRLFDPGVVRTSPTSIGPLQQRCSFCTVFHCQTISSRSSLSSSVDSKRHFSSSRALFFSTSSSSSSSSSSSGPSSRYNHYETLGVAEDATPQDIKKGRFYLPLSLFL